MFHITFWLILASSLLQIGIGVVQYAVQQSLGLKILGEEYIRTYLSGIAKFQMFHGERWVFDKLAGVSRETFIIRPYGTFPHANLFGAFIFVSLIVSYYLFLVSRETWKKVVVSLAIFLQIIGLTLSFSRVAMVAALVATAIYIFLFYMKQIRGGAEPAGEEGRNLKNLVRVLVVCAFITFLLFYPQFLERAGIVSYGTNNSEALSERVLYQDISFQMIKNHPLSGVGFQNFVSAMSNYSPVALKDSQFQPVHNIYLLIAAETGLVGLALFLLFIGSILFLVWKRGLNRESSVLLAIFLSLLFVGFFDHYLWTIQQGRLIFFLVAGLLVAASGVETKTES